MDASSVIVGIASASLMASGVAVYVMLFVKAEIGPLISKVDDHGKDIVRLYKASGEDRERIVRVETEIETTRNRTS